jgi:flagellar hook-basal body complex protein FliE
MRIGPDPFAERILIIQPIQSRIDKVDNEESNTKPFSEILEIALTGTNDTARELSRQSREASLQVLMGEVEDLPGNLITGQKSSLAADLNIQIRNRVIDAYNEIMRWQV